MKNINISIIIPTFNGGDLWMNAAKKINDYNDNYRIVTIDSSSSDKTIDVINDFSFELHNIAINEFNHGGTRNLAAKICSDSEYIIFLTQDAILYDESAIKNILQPFFLDKKIAAVCGRQIPHDNANPIAQHARIFNYPSESKIRDILDIPQDGIKVAFMSNSFSAYRTDVFFKLGGFPANTILAEDMYLAARIILAGYKIAYTAEAKVKHSHNYTPWQELKRYFDIGVFHAQEPWIKKHFGNVKGEGKKFLLSEFKYLIRHSPLFLPMSFIQNIFKLIGYKLGLKYNFLSVSMRRKISMHNRYWK